MESKKLFIGSSTESLPIAEAVMYHLNKNKIAKATMWPREFYLSSYTLVDLLNAIDKRNFDYAIFIFGGDDKIESRGVTKLTPRDNVIFEAGLFIGRLGFNRVFFLIPKSINKKKVDIKILSDLAGLNLSYVEIDDTSSEELLSSVHTFCYELKMTLQKHAREQMDDAVGVQNIDCRTHVTICNEEGDCVVKEYCTIQSAHSSLHKRRIKLYSFVNQIDLNDLHFEAFLENGQRLHVENVTELQLPARIVLEIFVPLQPGVQQRYYFKYEWKALVPKKTDAYNVLLFANSNSIVINYPLHWGRMIYFLTTREETNDEIKITGQTHSQTIDEHSCEIEFHSREIGKTARVSWRRA